MLTMLAYAALIVGFLLFACAMCYKIDNDDFHLRDYIFPIPRAILRIFPDKADHWVMAPVWLLIPKRYN